MQHEIVISGFGGQGALFAGQLLAKCFICQMVKRPTSIRDRPSDRRKASVLADEALEDDSVTAGYLVKFLMHGGIALALMDEALAWALYFQGMYGVTARVETRFRQPIPVGTKMVVRAWTVQQRRQLVEARAEIRGDSDGNPLLAEATATMYVQEELPAPLEG